MKKIRYILTGASGHLGNTILQRLQRTGAEVMALILPGEKEYGKANYVRGDVRSKESLRPLFEGAEGKEVQVIHTAGIIDISEKGSELLQEVNIGGTKNLLELSREYGVNRFLYVSSVHAIPEGEKYDVITETGSFDPQNVIGAYAKTKAAATQAVLDAGREGLDVVVVHPSGIIGPNDHSGNHLVQMITDYLKGKLPACVKGGYDFVDVRDVADGCLLALQKGTSGSCYILSGRHYDIQEVLGMAGQESGRKKLPVLPIWLARMAVPAITWQAKRKKERPLYTSYSLHTLQSNDRFSHDKATRELGYTPRDLRATIRDTVRWYRKQPVQL